MARGLRYQHRRSCDLITPYGTATLDEEGNVINLGDFEIEDLATIPGMVDTEVFGEVKPNPKPKTETTPVETKDVSDDDYWTLIKELTEGGKNLNSEGYVQMEVLTIAIRNKGWPPISGTRRLRITDAAREKK